MSAPATGTDLATALVLCAMKNRARYERGEEDEEDEERAGPVAGIVLKVDPIKGVLIDDQQDAAGNPRVFQSTAVAMRYASRYGRDGARRTTVTEHSSSQARGDDRDSREP